MAETLATWVTGLFSGYLPKETIIFVISMLPVLELRGGLIAAALLDIPLWKAIGICFIGNIIPFPFVMLFTRPVFRYLRKTKLFQPFVKMIENRADRQKDRLKKYEFWGLLVFVGIPLPGTGVWTGAMIASLLNISIKRATLPIVLGMCMATVLMCILTYGIPSLF